MHVQTALELLNNLVSAAARVPGPGRSLAAKVGQAAAAVNRHDTATACAVLQAFLNEIAAQRGKNLTNLAADQFTAAAQLIRAVLGC